MPAPDSRRRRLPQMPVSPGDLRAASDRQRDADWQQRGEPRQEHQPGTVCRQGGAARRGVARAPRSARDQQDGRRGADRPKRFPSGGTPDGTEDPARSTAPTPTRPAPRPAPSTSAPARNTANSSSADPDHLAPDVRWKQWSRVGGPSTVRRARRSVPTAVRRPSWSAGRLAETGSFNRSGSALEEFRVDVARRRTGGSSSTRARNGIVVGPLR